MMLRIFRAIRIEFAQALRTRNFWAGPILIVLTVLAIAGLHLSRGTDLDYDFVAYATGVAYGFGGLLLVLAFSALLIATDMHSGTARLYLTGPIKRHEYVLAKALFAMTYAVMLLLLTTAATWACAALQNGLGGVVYGGEVVYTSRQMQLAYLQGLGLALFPAAAAVAYGLLWSVLFRTPAAALIGALGSWLVIDALKYPLHLDRIVFWSYWTTPWMAFRNRCDVLPYDGRDDILLCTAVACVSLLLALATAITVFRRRNL